MTRVAAVATRITDGGATKTHEGRSGGTAVIHKPLDGKLKSWIMLTSIHVHSGFLYIVLLDSITNASEPLLFTSKVFLNL